jgi:hypothetical protein
MMIWLSGKASASPEASPPPPHGVTTRVGRAAELLGDFEAGTALPLDHIHIVERRHQRRAALAGDTGGNHLAAFGMPIVEHDLRAQRCRIVEFHLGRIGRHHDRRGHAEQPAARATPWAWLPDEKATTPR